MFCSSTRMTFPFKRLARLGRLYCTMAPEPHPQAPPLSPSSFVDASHVTIQYPCSSLRDALKAPTPPHRLLHRPLGCQHRRLAASALNFPPATVTLATLAVSKGFVHPGHPPRLDFNRIPGFVVTVSHTVRLSRLSELEHSVIEYHHELDFGLYFHCGYEPGQF